MYELVGYVVENVGFGKSILWKVRVWVDVVESGGCDKDCRGCLGVWWIM